MAKSIKERSEALKAKIRKKQGEIDVLWAHVRVLQTECKHPNRYDTSCMGDRGTHCPDCGHST